MDPESSPDPAGADSPDSDSTPEATEVVPAGAEALFPAVPIEALAPPAPIDQVLAQPTPAEALVGSDPALILSAAMDLDPAIEVAVPSLQEVVSLAGKADGAAGILPGGGEMGARTRAFNWSQTVIGSVSEWTVTLQSAVSTMLASGFPTLIAWGSEYIQLYNDAFISVLGSTKHPAALGQRAAECWPEIWTTLLAPTFRQVLATGEPFRSEERLLILNRHGYLEETYFTLSFSAIRGADGRPAGVLVTSVEMTERVLVERRLRTLHELASHGSLSDTVDATCEVIAATLRANPNDLPFALLYFVSKDGVRADLCTTAHLEAGTHASPDRIDLSSAADRDTVWPIARVLQTDRSEVVGNLHASVGVLPGGPWPESADAAVVLPIRQVGNEQYPTGALVAGISPRLRLDGAYRGFLDAVAAHVSTALSNARAHESGRQRADALVEVDRAKTAFFGNVSHELRTPLTLMLGPAGDLLAGDHGPISAAQRVQIRMLRRNSARLLKMVNSLLDFSEIEAGRVNATFEPTDLAAFTIDLASVFRSAVERAGLLLNVDCPPLDEPIYVDRDMWEKIVLNLLSNALKFTIEGSIEVSLRSTGQHVELVVADTGAGIAPMDVPHLFRHFHRVRATAARSPDGSGIGLALVHELVRFHGGSVNVVSEPGRGSTFSVCLLRGHAHLPVDRIRRTRSLTSAPGGAAPFIEEALRWLDDPSVEDPPVEAARVDDSTAAGGAPGVGLQDATRSARVLVIDDHSDMRQYLVRLLRRRWNVDAAANGLEGLESIRARRPDLVIADMMMPELDGAGLLRELRADSSTASIPVLLLSARAGEDARIEGLRAGAADYIVKPFFARELITKVQNQIEQLWLRKRADEERARLRSLFNDAPIPICILRGEELRYEFVNPPYARMFGDRALVGRTIREALPGVHGGSMIEALEGVFRTGKTYWGIEVPIRLEPERHDADADAAAYFNVVYQAMHDAQGGVDGIVGFAVNVTGQVAARRTIEESMETRDTFFAAVAHELRGPINAVQLGLLSVLRSANESDEPLPADWIRRRVGKAAEQASRLIRLIDNLLEASRIASGRLHLQIEPTDLTAVASEVLDRLDAAEQAQITRTLESATGQWDRLRLDQVLTNLVSNALKYGEGRPIGVTVRNGPAQAELEVSDHGIGIAPEHQARIFERFERVVADRRRYAGFGLGLWITSRIVEEFGGSLAVRSAPGAGSTFTVRLPKQPPSRTISS